MQNEQTWKNFFRFAALFNFAAALSLLFASELFFSLLMMPDRLTIEAVPWVHQFAVLVATFGVGYWAISLDPAGKRDIIWMGCLGKTLVFLMAWFDFFFNELPIGFPLLVVADLAFAGVYLFFLRSLGRASSYGREVIR